MLYTIAVILLIAWLLGVVGTYTIGAFVHGGAQASSGKWRKLRELERDPGLERIGRTERAADDCGARAHRHHCHGVHTEPRP